MLRSNTKLPSCKNQGELPVDYCLVIESLESLLYYLFLFICVHVYICIDVDMAHRCMIVPSFTLVLWTWTQTLRACAVITWPAIVIFSGLLPKFSRERTAAFPSVPQMLSYCVLASVTYFLRVNLSFCFGGFLKWWCLGEVIYLVDPINTKYLQCKCLWETRSGFMSKWDSVWTSIGSIVADSSGVE